VSQLEKVT